MSVRLLAMEVYRAMRKVDELEKSLRHLPPGSAEKPELQKQLAEARAELAHLRALMAGAKY